MELIDFVKPLRRWWWLIILSTVVAAGASFLTTRQQAPVYQAQAGVMIGRAIENPNPTGSEFWLGQQLAQTYVAMATRKPVRDATMGALGLTWLPEYTVEAVPNTLLIEAKVTDTNPERAAVVANELVNQLVLRSPTGSELDERSRQAFINAQLNDLELQIEATQTEINEKQSALGDMFSARQIADTQTQIAALGQKLNTLQANYAGLLANTQQGAINTLSVVEQATVPTTPVGPNKGLTIVTAAAIGLVLAMGAAYLLEYLDDSIKSPNELQQLGGAPTLGNIIRMETADESSTLITISEPRSNVAEAYRGLRTAIQFSTLSTGDRTMAITSANPGEGKTVTSANIAAVFAQAGKRVLLVDADLRRPKQHKLFELSNYLGLSWLFVSLDPGSDIGVQEALVQDVVQPTSQRNLWVMPSGPLPPNPSELLGSPKMKVIIDLLTRQYDLIIFDTPPVLAVTDAVVVSSAVESTLLVVQAQTTRAEAVRKASVLLRDANAELIGFVMNMIPRGGPGSYQYYYVNYSYGSHSDDGDGNSPHVRKKKRRERNPLQRVLDGMRG